MITVLTATNRNGNNTQIIAEKYLEFLHAEGAKAQYFSLELLPNDFSFMSIHQTKSEAFKQLLDTYFKSAQKIVIVVPEYNGSYPGVLKSFIDATRPEIWHGKKVSLVGIASGRGGNVLGMEHLSSILHHLQMIIMPQRLPISRVEELVQERVLKDEITLDLIHKHAKRFIHF